MNKNGNERLAKQVQIGSCVIGKLIINNASVLVSCGSCNKLSHIWLKTTEIYFS